MYVDSYNKVVRGWGFGVTILNSVNRGGFECTLKMAVFPPSYTLYFG